MNSDVDPFPPKRPRRSRLLLRLALGGTVLAVLLATRPVQWPELGAALAQARPGWLMVAALGFLVLMALKTWRWRVLIRRIGGTYGFLPAYGAYLGAFALGIVTPGRLGEFARATNLAREAGVPWQLSFRSVISDRVFDLVFLIGFGPLALDAILFPPPRAGVLWTGTAALIAGISLSLAALGRKLGAWSSPSHQALRAARWLSLVLSDLVGAAGWAAAAITGAAYLTFFAASLALFKSIALELHFGEAACVTGCLSLIVLLPISVAGIGTREAGLVFLLGKLGIPAEQALACSVLQFAIFTLFGGLVGAAFLAATPRSAASSAPPRPAPAAPTPPAHDP